MNTSQNTQRLKAGHKLLLAGPDFILPYSLTNMVNKSIEPGDVINEDILTHLLQEFISIYKLLTRLVGKEALHVIKTSFYMGSHRIDTPSDARSIRFNLPVGIDFGSIETTFIMEPFRSWPRDAYVLLDKYIFANFDALNRDLRAENVIVSGLGDGGKVLARGRALLVTHDIWHAEKNEIKHLCQEGFRVGCLPFVLKSSQSYEFESTHIDGHAALIEDSNGNLVLLVAKSYLRQGNHSKKNIIQASESIGARMIEIDDRDLPPLPLNLIQFEDRSIALSRTPIGDLETILKNLAGENNVFATDISLEFIPKLTRGGMRCLTNMMPICFQV